MSAAFPHELARWLEAQERFESLRSRAVRTGGRALCDLAYPNPPEGPSDAVRRALHRALDEQRGHGLQYTPYGGATVPRREVARRLRKSHGADFRFRHVVLTPGAMAALQIALRAVRQDDGDEVLVPVPCWLDYPLYVESLGMRARLVRLQPESFDLDVDAIANALSPRTRAVLLSTPANPTGRVYPRAQLARLASVLERSAAKPLLISDECHRDAVFGPAGFVSPVGCYARTCVVYSFGKAHFIQGQRLGYLAVSPRMAEADMLALALERHCRAMGFGTPTALMQRALPALLELGPDAQRMAALRRRRQRALAVLRAAGISAVPSDGTCFLYVSAGGRDDVALSASLAEQGVLVLPSSVFHHHGYLRLALTADDASLERGLSDLVRLIAPPRAREGCA